MALLRGRRLLLTVTGGIAAYKAAELARLLTKSGALVRVVMTEAAKRFVAPLTFSSLTGQPTADDMWAQPPTADHIPHVAWAEWAELLITAPATADFLAKLACGLADDLASAIALAYAGPRLIAPAMNVGMYLNPATVHNLDVLKSRGVRVLGSPTGLLACGTTGPGRLAEPEVIALEAARLLSGGLLAGKKVLVTGGASQEKWDDIRFLSNRSSGRMGLSLAQAAWLMGSEVVLLAGPAAQVPKASLDGLAVFGFETTEDLLAKLTRFLKEDPPWALAMNAAPADFKPAKPISGKIGKAEDNRLELKLARTPDILSSLGSVKGRTIFIGFAAEAENLAARAAEKLRRKNLDFIAANQAGGEDSAFGSETTELTLLSAKNNEPTKIGPGPKFGAAWIFWETVAAMASTS
ncbi:MAG: bifunctional phosphopantothenoylcysteine decarboxylase/phosphopantothenate--cysteine ligase CoaBC [Deltaproteobacteria bacterium]|nr:bifunctional phosphopantothenoylcysteine decarboxylase/phosphopantothenate--cysteine ligase CoaBC [Deltaproteobacteria bacterium]